MAKYLGENTRVRFASPKFNNIKGIYENEYKKGYITKVLQNDYEIYCEELNEYRIVPKKGVTKDYYYYTSKEGMIVDEACTTE